MAYKVIILYQLYMPSYFLGTFTEYPILDFTLSADDMARIKTLDTDKPFLLGSHEDPEIVKWFMQYKNA